MPCSLRSSGTASSSLRPLKTGAAKSSERPKNRSHASNSSAYAVEGQIRLAVEDWRTAVSSTKWTLLVNPASRTIKATATTPWILYSGGAYA